MSSPASIKEYFDQALLPETNGKIGSLRKNAQQAYARLGIPTTRQEEWKYTRIAGLFNKAYQLSTDPLQIPFSARDINALRLPGHGNANELVFVNGLFSIELSKVISNDLVVLPLEEAANSEFNDIVTKHLGQSGHYLKDGINALNTAFVQAAAFVHMKRNKVLDHPVYIYHFLDTKNGNTFSQPRSLLHIGENSSLQLVETFFTLGTGESFTNQVMEIVVEKDAKLEYYKIQNDSADSSQVSTTHIRQLGKSYTHTVVISLNGNIVRNNLDVIFEADHCESHLYGLYCLKGQTHVDNHTIVDNVQPHCFSNELYKGIVDGKATGIFNGKIFVRKDAQKTNAYQSNKNILLSETATVNAKPQLEIFADDVKCSHGCTVGSLDEEALFYLRSRGLSKDEARSLLLQAFAMDILENIHLEAIRSHVSALISQRLEINEHDRIRDDIE